MSFTRRRSLSLPLLSSPLRQLGVPRPPLRTALQALVPPPHTRHSSLRRPRNSFFSPLSPFVEAM